MGILTESLKIAGNPSTGNAKVNWPGKAKGNTTSTYTRTSSLIIRMSAKITFLREHKKLYAPPDSFTTSCAASSSSRQFTCRVIFIFLTNRGVILKFLLPLRRISWLLKLPCDAGLHKHIRSSFWA